MQAGKQWREVAAGGMGGSRRSRLATMSRLEAYLRRYAATLSSNNWLILHMYTQQIEIGFEAGNVLCLLAYIVTWFCALYFSFLACICVWKHVFICNDVQAFFIFYAVCI